MKNKSKLFLGSEWFEDLIFAIIITPSIILIILYTIAELIIECLWAILKAISKYTLLPIACWVIIIVDKIKRRSVKWQKTQNSY